jgi:hypothetical protein
MGDDDAELAREAYVIHQQLAEMQATYDKAPGGYHAFARTYNVHLARSKEILETDPAIGRSIAQLEPYDQEKQTGYASDSQQMRADIAILGSALRSFCEFHFPAQEKARIGFK